MAGINRCLIVGTLDRDPESRTMPSGTALCALRIETSDEWSDRASGERKERKTWHTCSVFGDAAATIAQHGRAGMRVLVEGALSTRKYTDAQGNDRTVTEVVVTQFRGSAELLDLKSNGHTSEAPRRNQQTSRPPSRDKTSKIEDDEIPWMSDPPSIPA